MSSAVPPATTPPGSGGAARGRQGPLDMVRSTALVLGIVVALLLLVPRPDAPARPEADVAGAARAAEAGGVPAVVPQVPDGWEPNAARVDVVQGARTWHVGYVTPSQRYAGVRTTGQGQDEEASARWFSEVTGEGREVGRRDLGGRTWRELLSGDGRRRSLVLDGGAAETVVPGTATTVVTGTATLDELALLARAVTAAG